MNDFDVVDSIEWHDGILLEVKTIFSDSHFNLVLIIDVYRNESVREKMIVEFFDIDNLVLTMDTNELNDNYRSGNISNGYIKKEKKYKFFLYLSDGLLSMSFKKLQLINPLDD